MSSDQITFTLNEKQVTAQAGESIWQISKREGIDIPHLCYNDTKGHRADGNCRVCMVDIEGERTLAPSCCRSPNNGMKINTESDRAVASRKMVMELMLADQKPEDITEQATPLAKWANNMQLTTSRFPAKQQPKQDISHPAIAVNLDACINCNLCVRACREIQVNDVIGMAYRGSDEKIVFDFDDAMGESTCVGCGECVQACPTTALQSKTALDQNTGRALIADKTVRSVCPYCGVGCQLNYNVKDNKIISIDGVDGPGNEGRLCVKGRYGFDYINSEQRLTQPLIRKAGFEKGVNIDPANPLSHFRVATWDEALDAARDGFLKVKNEDGPTALAGFGSAKCSNEEAYLFQKLIRTGFASNNVDHCTRLCHASSVTALIEGIGSGAVTAPFTAVKDSDVIVVIGANPSENHPVASSFFKQAVKNGAELIVMDPRAHALKQHASHMLQFKPGADVALLNAIMHVIVKEKLYNQDYIQKHTQGFSELCEHLEAYSAEKMSPICNISVEEIKTVARKYAKANAAIILWGMGVSQSVHGTDNARCLIALALMCGQTGRPGTGLHPLRGQNNVQGASDAALIPMFLPDYQPVDDPQTRQRFEKVWGTEIDPVPGLTVVETINAAYDRQVKAMYIMGENPAMSDPDQNHARAALAKLDHMVVQDIFLTETAMFADVILPATAWPEKDGTATNSNRQIQRGRKVVEAPGEAKPDWWITCEIAKRLGLGWDYQDPSEVFEEMKLLMPSFDNISWDRLKQENSVTYPCLDENLPGEEIVFSDSFPTESGHARFVAASLSPSNETVDPQYPFVLATGRQLEHWHTGSMTRRSDVLDAIEPEAIIQMNQLDLAELGIQPGEMVKVSSRRGSIQIKARSDNRVSKGSVYIPFAFVEACANLLTSPKLDPFGKIPEFKYSAVSIQKISA